MRTDVVRRNPQVVGKGVGESQDWRDQLRLGALEGGARRRPKARSAEDPVVTNDPVHILLVDERPEGLTDLEAALALEGLPDICITTSTNIVTTSIMLNSKSWASHRFSC